MHSETKMTAERAASLLRRFKGGEKTLCAREQQAFDFAIAALVSRGEQQDMTVIDPAQWEPCSPEYLSSGGRCDAPRVWNAKYGNHWHPKAARQPLWEQRSDWVLLPRDPVVALPCLRALADAAGVERLPDPNDDVSYPITGRQSTVRQWYAAILDAAQSEGLVAAVNKPQERGYWVIQCPVITTAHLTQEAAEILAQTLPGEDFYGAPCMVGSHGGAIGSSEAVKLDERAPKCVRDVINWSRREGFNWVRLDADGDQIGELTTYDW